MLRDRLGVLASWGVCAWLLLSLPQALSEASERFVEAFRHARETPDEVFARFRGAPYVEAIRRIRAAVPADGAYGLVEEAGETSDIARKLARFDLTPRRALYLGKLGSLSLAQFGELPPLTVIVKRNGEVPALVATTSLSPPPR
ncbi:MAG TPA: hypothetical protein VKF32_06240 [Thermoanaerobaculia bacterium]|nr:hypothetical protein [Thermoanaerobaculia bacterium]